MSTIIKTTKTTLVVVVLFVTNSVFLIQNTVEGWISRHNYEHRLIVAQLQRRSLYYTGNANFFTTQQLEDGLSRQRQNNNCNSSIQKGNNNNNRIRKTVLFQMTKDTISSEQQDDVISSNSEIIATIQHDERNNYNKTKVDVGNIKNSIYDEESKKIYFGNLKLSNLAKKANNKKHTIITNKMKVQIGIEAIQTFRTMSVRDTVTYNTLFKILSNISPIKIYGFPTWHYIDKIFNSMKYIYKQSIIQNQLWYKRMNEMDHEQIIKGPPKINNIQPNVRTYATIIDAYGKYGTEQSAIRCEQLLQELHDLYNDSVQLKKSKSNSTSIHNNNEYIGNNGDNNDKKKYEYEDDNDELHSLKPNTYVYNSILSAWSKVGGELGASKCLEWLNKMEKEEVDVIDQISYNIVLHSLAQSGLPNAGEQAEYILNSMLLPNVKPNARTYTTCMDAYSRCKQPDDAYRLLQTLIELYNKTNDTSIQPDTVSYSTVIHAYAISDNYNKTNIALELYNDMIQSGIKPNKFTYNTILNCIATSNNVDIIHLNSSISIDTLKDMIRTFKDIFNQVITNKQADQATFGTAIKVCNTLQLPIDVTCKIFNIAIQHGMVSSGVVYQFKQSVPSHIYQQIVNIGSNDDNANNNNDDDHLLLPSEWTRNIVWENEKRHRRHRRI